MKLWVFETFLALKDKERYMKLWVFETFLALKDKERYEIVSLWNLLGPKR